jgi:hypothetical protein
MAVCRELHAIRQALSQILDEMMRGSRVTATAVLRRLRLQFENRLAVA